MSDFEVTAAARRIHESDKPKRLPKRAGSALGDASKVKHLVAGGSRVATEAADFMQTMPEEKRQSFRDRFLAAIQEKAAGNPVKARKLLLAAGDTARAVLGETFGSIKKQFD